MHAPNINPQDPRWQDIAGNSPAAGGAQQWPTKEIIEAQQAQNGAQGVNATGANPIPVPQLWALSFDGGVHWSCWRNNPALGNWNIHQPMPTHVCELVPKSSVPPVHAPTDWDRKMDRLYNWVHENGLWEAFEDNVNPYSHLENRAKDEAKVAQELADDRFQQNVKLRKNQADAAQVRAYLAETIEQRDNQIAQVKELLARMKQVLTGVQCAPESNGYVSTTTVGPETL